MGTREEGDMIDPPLSREHIVLEFLYFKRSGKFYAQANGHFDPSMFENCIVVESDSTRKRDCIYPKEFGERLNELKKLPGLQSGTWNEGPFVVNNGQYCELVVPPEKITKSFVTGSWAYSEPNKESDLDLVVLVSDADHERIMKAHQPGWKEFECATEYARQNLRSFRFGVLNLLLAKDEQAFEIWRYGTAELRKQAPVTRDFACTFMANLRKQYGV